VQMQDSRSDVRVSCILCGCTGGMASGCSCLVLSPCEGKEDHGPSSHTRISMCFQCHSFLIIISFEFYFVCHEKILSVKRKKSLAAAASLDLVVIILFPENKQQTVRGLKMLQCQFDFFFSISDMFGL